MALYRVTIYRTGQYDRCYEASESWIVGTLRAAELTALDKLPAAHETDYSARFARLPYAEVQSVVRFRSLLDPVSHLREIGPIKACHETPIVYVPSVGDLGYTP